MRQNRRRKNRQNTGRARRCWKGMLAVIAAAATFLTGIDVTGLQTVFANGTSGYKIEVSYSEDQSQATLTGNADRLGQGVTLVSVTDAEGKEYSPSEFSYPVTENGDYTFTVDYKVEEAALIREEKEELTVTVDGIQKAGTEENAPKDDNVAQERMAVSALLAQAQNAEEQITPYELPVYTSESNLALGQTKIPYSGGVFSEELTGELTDYPGRVFDYAYFVFSGDDTEFPLLGLYPLYNEAEKKTEWYYILQDESGSGSGGTSGSVMGDIEAKVAIKLPDNAEVRAKYKVTSQAYPITPKYMTPENREDKDPESIKRWSTSLVEQGRAGEKIIVTFTVPTEYTSAVVEVSKIDGTNIKTFDTANAKSTGLEENVGGVDGRYSGIFDMMDQAVTVTFKAQIAGEQNFKDFGFAWPRSENRDSGNTSIEAGRTYASINTDSKGKAEYKISYLSDTNSSEVKTRLYEDPAYRPSGSVQKIPLYNASDELKDRRITQGKYKTGETQTIRVQYELSSYSDSTNNRYTYIPTILDFYVYKGVSFGTDPSNSNVLVEQISLPQIKNETITQQLETGGTVKITLKEKKNRTPNQQVPDGDFGQDRWGEAYDKYSSGDREVNHPYWEYEIKVSKTRYPYVVSLIDDSGAQEGFVVKEMTGVEQGEVTDVGSTDPEYSTYFENRNSAGRKEYPLVVGSVLWQKYMADKHPTTKRSATMLHLVPKMGYGWPTITLANNATGQQPGRDITPQETPNGKTYYTHYISSAESGASYRDTVTEIKIAAEPITLNVKYASDTGGGSDPSAGTKTLRPSSDRYYSVILQNNLVSSGKYMNGYTLKIKNNENKEITISNPNDRNGKWYPGDILDVQDLYWQMASANSSGTPFLLQGQEAAINTYTMTFTANVSDTPTDGSYGNIGYTIRTQTDFNNWTGDPTNEDHEVMYKTGFSNRTDTVMGYIGSQTLLRNYPEYVEDGTKKYIVSDYSVTESVITGTDDKLDLVYLLGAQVEFTGLRSNFSNNLVDKPGNSGTYVYAEETWFTGMDKHDNVIDLRSIDPGDPEANKVFAGWKIKNTGGESYNGGAPINDSLDLYNMGNTDPDLWNQIFKTDGVIKLEAQWTEAYGPIKHISGRTTDDYNDWDNPDYFEVHTGGDPITEIQTDKKGVKITAQFQYDGLWADNAAQTNFALYREKATPNNEFKLWAYNRNALSEASTADVDLWTHVNNAGDKLHTQASLKVNESSKTFEISFWILDRGNNGIRYDWEDISATTRYRIYAWNDKNGVVTKNEAKPPEISGGVGMMPCVKDGLKVLPKAITSKSGYAGSGTETDKGTQGDGIKAQVKVAQEVYAEETFKVTAEFTGDNLYPGNLQTGDTATEEAKIHAALYKKNPKESNFILWATEAGAVTKHTGKVETPEISVDNSGNISVSFQIIDKETNGDHSINWEWDNDAEYRILVWNATNTNGTPFTPPETYAGESFNVIPEVTTPIELRWKNPEYYVKIPATIILTDKGDVFTDGEKSDYAGAAASVTYEVFSETVKPEVEVKVKDAQTMTITDPAGGSGTLTMNIYSKEGERRQPSADGYSWLGILSTKTTDPTSGNIQSQNASVTIPNGLPRGESLPFQINAQTGNASRKEMYHGTLNYDFTLRDYDNPSTGTTP